MAIQADGKVLIGGAFTAVNGVTRNRLARLNTNGSLDVDFDPALGFNSTVQAVVVQPDGKIIAGGSFSRYQSVDTRYLVRLLANAAVDETFLIGSGPDNTVVDLELAADGRVLVGGNFSQFNGLSQARVARLLADGTVDPTFDPGQGPNAEVRTVLTQTDGRILLGGSFTEVNGTSRNRLARLTTAGLLDLGFTLGEGANNTVNTVGLHADGKIVVGGSFTQFAGQTRNRLVRLMPEGTLDPAFLTGSGPNNTINTVWVQPDGNILVGGEFTQYNGATHNRLVRLQGATSAAGGALEFTVAAFTISESGGSATIEVVRTGPTTQAVSVSYATANGTANSTDYTPASGTLNFAVGQNSASFTVTVTSDSVPEDDETVILRLSNPTGGAELGSRRESVLVIVNDDRAEGPGSVDPDFAELGANGGVNVLTQVGSDKLIAAGNFTQIAGVNRNRIARLESNGQVDAAFNAAAYANNSIEAVAVQADGKILIGGSFTIVNGVTRNRLARLNANGSLDTGFDPAGGFNSTVHAIAVQTDGSILVGGSFTRYQGANHPYLMRLLANASVDEAFGIGTGPDNAVYDLELTTDGRILLGGNFGQIDGRPSPRVARLLATGAPDPAFDPGQGPNADVRTVLIQPDGRILLGGNFTVINGSTRNRLARLTPAGLLDTEFTIEGGANNTVASVGLQADGKIVLAGSFTQFGGQTRNRVVRLLPEGTIDPAFAIGAGANNTISALVVQPNGDIVLGGEFTQFDGLSHLRLVRLQGTPSATGGALEFAAPVFTAAEESGNATIQVVRVGSTSQAVTVNYATANGTANVADYTSANGVLNFAAGQTTATFNVPILPDSTLEDDETVILRLSNPTGGAELVGYREALLVIANDDSTAGPGVVDLDYLKSGANGAVRTLVAAGGGKLIAAGDFTVLGGLNRNRIARLEADGTVDATFNPAAYANNAIESLAVQTDGKILIGGQFTEVNGFTRNRLARLEADGALDLSFNPGAGFNSTVYALAVQTDGKILAGGSFSRYQGVNQAYLVRLQPDANVDDAFAIGTGPDNAVYDLELMTDGRVLIGGSFIRIDGRHAPRLARLLTDGSPDPTFGPGQGPNGDVQAVLTQPDGRILLAGNFTQVNGSTRNHLARLTPEGLLDADFSIGANNTVTSLGLQADGKILAGGSFTQFGGQTQNRLVRLLPEGALDPAFVIGTGANDTVHTLYVQPNGDMLVGGEFTQFSGFIHHRLVRLQGPTSAVGGALEFSVAKFTVSESAASATIEVVRVGAASQPVSVNYTTANGTATVADYTSTSGTLNFAAGQTAATFTVPILPDNSMEDDETVILRLSNPTGGAELASRRESHLVIINDDQTAGPGAMNRQFVAAGANGAVLKLVPTGDGKLMVGGDFTVLAGVNRNHIVRLEADGSVDMTFNPAAYANNTVETIALQTDGKILIGGQFTEVNGFTRNRLARLNADGSLDVEFDPLGGFNSTVEAVAVQTDGKILVGSRYRGVNRLYLVRLLSDGEVDDAFGIGTGPDNVVYDLKLAADGTVLIGGVFGQIDGRPAPRLARLLPTGLPDPTFNPGQGANADIRALLIQPDGKILVGGNFTQFNGASRNRLARLTSQGLLDIDFVIAGGANNTVTSFALQTDSKILVGGSFTQFGGQANNRLVRLLPEGALDPAFALGSGANDTVHALHVQPDGDIVVGGEFTQFNGLTQNRLARLQGPTSAPGGALEFAVAAFTVSESAATATIEVVRVGATSQAVGVTYTTVNGTATSGADYTAASGTLNLAAGQTAANFTVSILPDNVLEDDETVILRLSNPTGGTELASRREALLFIVNDDRAEGPGAIDLDFVAAGANGAVLAVVPLNDGKLMIGGNFTSLGGLSRNRLARLEADGSLDMTFNPAAYANNAVETIAVQTDGRIFIGGQFTEVNGFTRNRLARLEADGSLDLLFDPGAGFNSTVQALAVQPDGKLIVGGAFSRYQNANLPYLTRLLPDATVDETFAIGTGPNNVIYDLELLVDGRIVIGGSFGQVNGSPLVRIGRLLANGSVDATFDPAQGPNADVRTLLVEPDGRIVLGGTFTQVRAVGRNRIARLNEDGTLDDTFAPGSGFNNTVWTLARQADGRLLAGGSFTTFNGGSFTRIARLNPTGEADVYFNTFGGANDDVTAIYAQPDEAIVIGGSFTSFGGIARDRLVRLLGGEGQPPTALKFLSISVDATTIDLLVEGVVGQSYRIEASPDLLNWVTAATGTITQSPFAVSIDLEDLPMEFFRGITLP
ncbi:MAG: hypothetical protein KJ072_05225 [Verrucomicrobia bacterium]|nr:hypothetical protein [Verrucomicrobiota bacterium]